MMLNPSMHSTTLLLWSLIWHLFADWILQNDFLARYKSSLKHPAAYIHSGIHLAGLLFILPPIAALCIAILHLLIDTRVPLVWWRGFFRQTTQGPVVNHVAIWSDQVLHITILAIAALIVGG